MDRPYCLYDVLNVSPGAPAPMIEASYRLLMKKHHPDQAGPEASSRAAEINAAFSILRDPERRACYDRREQARQRAMIESQVGKLRRRRRIAGWAGWGASAALIFAATALAAERYGGALVRPVQPVAVESSKVPEPRADRVDPEALVSEVLAETRKLTLAPRPAPPRPSRTSAAEPPLPAAARQPRRAAQAPPAAEEAAGDFLERHEHIY